MAPTYYFDKRGQWSGGGKAFLNNVAHAEERHPILRGGPRAIPIIPRNVPVPESRRVKRFLLAPQNAWAWSPTSEGLQELKFVSGLRLASAYYGRKSSGIFRISGAIPAVNGRPSSPVTHNVLDPTFESALIDSQSIRVEAAEGKVVSIGSGHSYRNLVGLIDGFKTYRAAGGRLGLWIAGPQGSPRARERVDRVADGVDGLVLNWGALARSECLAAFRGAAGVILPSLVEASPVVALEAVAVNPNIVLSDIIGHREIIAEYGHLPGEALFDPGSAGDIARAIRSISEGYGVGPHQVLMNADMREAARETWGRRLTAWLSTI